MAGYAHHFGIDNIPYGIASCDLHPRPQCVSRVADSVIFLSVLVDAGHLPISLQATFSQSSLNEFAALPKETHILVRRAVQDLQKSPHSMPANSGVHISGVCMHLPVAIGDFTDFSASKNHVLNAGEAVFGTRSLPPGFLHFPLAYQGRASSVVVSGTDVARPVGQFLDKSEDEPRVVCTPSRAMDYELELGAIVGKPLATGTRVAASRAAEHIFGFVLVNDWSARDIQGFEMAPLGPFAGKSFATSISAWVVTPEALKPFEERLPSLNPAPHPHLLSLTRTTHDVTLTVEVIHGEDETVTCRTKLDSLYWNFSEMLAHMTVGGCSLRTGDLIASGTLSGDEESTHGCLLELSMGGKNAFQLRGGSTRTYLQDGDSVRFTAVAGRGTEGVGFGECFGSLKAATPL